MENGRVTFWLEVFKDGQQDLIREMVYDIKAAEAEKLLREGRGLGYVLERADPLDVLVFLQQEGARGVLYHNGQVCQEGELIDLVLFLEEQDSLSEYRLERVPFPG